MFQVKTTELHKNQVIQYSIAENEQCCSVRQWINLLQESKDFRWQFNQILKDCPFQAFFWEVKPMNVDTLENDFEFVMVNSQILNRIQANSRNFERYFETDKSVVAFPNLGKDAQLIVPTPQSNHQYYAHLANFVRNAPDSQIDDFWRTVGAELQHHLGNAPKWLSTAGLGVSWLHVRIDSRPKYYRYQGYKIFEV